MATAPIDSATVSSMMRTQETQANATPVTPNIAPVDGAGFDRGSTKRDLNTKLVEGLNVSLSSGVQPMNLLYKAAVDRINQELSKISNVEGQKPPSDLLQQKLAEDNSAEATAGRILNGALSFFDSYAKQNPQMDKEELVNSFVETVRGGFEKGYKDAINTLDSLKVFDGAVKSDVEKTYDVVSKGFDDFITQQLNTQQQTENKNAANNGNDGVKQGTVPKD